MPNNHANKITGRLGEDIACNFLEKLGYKILAKNYRYSRFAEIDIVAKDKDTIVFTEVKTRCGTNFGHPFEAVNHKKLLNIFKAGLHYLQNNKEYYKRYRIDIVSVILNAQNTTQDIEPVIEHLKDVSLN